MTEALLCWRAPPFRTKNVRYLARSLVLRRDKRFHVQPSFMCTDTGGAAGALRAPCHRVVKTVHGLLQTLAGALIALGTVFAVIYKQPSNNMHF